MRATITAAAAALSLCVLAAPASAVTPNSIEIRDLFDANGNATPNGDFIGTLSCPHGCVGFLFDGATSDAFAEAFTSGGNTEVGPSNEPNEVSFLNGLAGTSFDENDPASYDKQDSGTFDPLDFDVDRQFFTLKLGGFNAFFRLNGGPQEGLEFVQASGQGGQGLSHITGIGDTAVVPLPAAAWLLLSGVAGLGVFGRRKRAA